MVLLIKIKFSNNVDNTKKADHILEIPGIGNFFYNCLRNLTLILKEGCRLNVTNKYKDQRRLSNRNFSLMYVKQFHKKEIYTELKI